MILGIFVAFSITSSSSRVLLLQYSSSSISTLALLYTLIHYHLTQVFSIDDNHKNLRQLTKESARPLVPYVGLYGKLLLNLEDGQSTITKEEQINVQKACLYLCVDLFLFLFFFSFLFSCCVVCDVSFIPPICLSVIKAVVRSCTTDSDQGQSILWCSLLVN